MQKTGLKTFKKIYLYLLICFALFSHISKVQAEQTIITMPSSEVLPVRDMLLKGGTSISPFSTEGNTSLTPSVTFGSGFGTELSTSIGTVLDTNRNTSVVGHLSAKKVWFLGSSTRLTTGGTLSPYLTHAVHPGTFIYAHLSQRIKKTRTSITAGGYFSGEKNFLNTGGVMLGIEQVIIPNKLRLAMDWLSGQDSYGRIGVGLKYRPIPSVSITSAVIIPNRDMDNIAFNLSVSKFISLDEYPIKKEIDKCESKKQL